MDPLLSFIILFFLVSCFVYILNKRVEEEDKMKKEIEIKDKRISLLSMYVSQKQRNDGCYIYTHIYTRFYEIYIYICRFN